MGINSVTLKWFDHLADMGIFTAKTSILELGPQDLFFDTDDLDSVAYHRLPDLLSADLKSRLTDTSISFKERQSAFYALFGLTDYESTDPYDKRADFAADLNVCNGLTKKYDVIIDCGTNEHVFNAANVFVFTHNSLKREGIMLKVLPCFGDNTHGFYNIHPTVFFDVARVNQYKILDFRYIDGMSRRNKDDIRSLLTKEQFEINLTSFLGCTSLQAQISKNFSKNLQCIISEGLINKSHSAVDYCFVAMQKTIENPFYYPGQGVYLTEFS